MSDSRESLKELKDRNCPKCGRKVLAVMAPPGVGYAILDHGVIDGSIEGCYVRPEEVNHGGAQE